MGRARRPEVPKTGWIRRNRSGCWNCKARKRKCTEEIPACSGCVRRNLECDYGIRLTWQDEAESLGIAFGRAGLKNRDSRVEPGGRSLPVTSAAPPKRPHYLLPLRGVSPGHHWLNTTFDDVLRLCMPTPHGEMAGCQPFIPCCPECPEPDPAGVPHPLRTFPELDDDGSSFLLEYYIKDWSNRRVLTDKSDNPYQQVILPLCLHSQGLMDMVIAFASHDMRNQCKGYDCGVYDSLLLRYKSRSLRYLREQLATSDDPVSASPRATGPGCAAALDGADAAGDMSGAMTALAACYNQTTRDALLLIIMLHGLLEIANNSTKEWAVHLKGALCTARHYRQTHGQAAFSREVLEFASNCFSQQDTFSATASWAVLSGGSETDEWRSEIDRTILDQGAITVQERSRVNGYTGMSAELLGIISSITSAVRDKRARRRRRRFSSSSTSSSPTDLRARTMDTDDIDLRAATIQSRLQKLRQWSDEPDPDSPANLNAAALKEAAWIYLRHGLCGEPVESTAIQTRHLPRLLKLLEGVHRRRTYPVGSTPYPMWALFVASCTAQEDQRAKVMGWFVELRKHLPYSNVPVTMAAVEAIWKKVDLERGGLRWCSCGDDGAPGASPAREAEGELVWEGAMHRLGWTMAFI